MHQDAFNLVAEGVLWVDEAGRVQYCNDAAAALLGYSRNGLLASSYFEVNPHFSILGWKKYWSRLSKHSFERLDTEFVNRDGKLFSIRGRAGFDIYAFEPELCVLVFESAEKGKREADLLASTERDANMGNWEVNLTTNQVYISTLVRKWLSLSNERQVYSTAEFTDLLKKRIAGDIYEEGRKAYKALKQTVDYCDFRTCLISDFGDEHPTLTEYILRAQSVENELEIFKVYGTICPAKQGSSIQNKLANGVDFTRVALDHQPNAVFVISYTDRKIVYANDRAVELTHYTKRELMAMAASQLVPPSNTRETAALYIKVRESKYVELETTMVCKDAAVLPVLARTYYFERDGEEFMIIISEDISDRTAYVGDRQLYATTLDALSEWVIWINANEKVVLLNEAARRKLSRKTSQDLVGLSISSLMPDLEIPSLAEIRQEKIDGRRRNAIDYVYTNASSEDRTLQVRFRQVAAGAQYFLCLICRDVTQQYTNKRKLQETKRRVDELTKQLQSENETLREQIEKVNTGGSIITVSKKYRKILGQIAQVADTDATVLVTGETGTGKELLAQSLHRFSSRGGKPLVSVNCAALPENLIESELFGHERGSFTGAFAQKKGKFELAHTSTIFLDEIGELPLDLQSKLLRVLQEGEIQRIGSTEVIHVDVRVVAATNRDLERMINQGTFREDLFYRLNVFPIHNLPLRERTEDIPVLVKHFAKVYSDRMGRNITHIKPQDLELLAAYDFPGNVRELINLVERAVITSKSSTLNLSDSLSALRRSSRGTDDGSFRNERIISFEAMQKQYIIEALRRTGGKVTGPGGAAEILDLNGRTLMSKMNKLGIDRNKFTG